MSHPCIDYECRWLLSRVSTSQGCSTRTRSAATLPPLSLTQQSRAFSIFTRQGGGGSAGTIFRVTFWGYWVPRLCPPTISLQLRSSIICLEMLHRPSHAPPAHQGSAAYVGDDKAVFDVPVIGPLMGSGAGLAWKGFETFSQISFRYSRTCTCFDLPYPSYIQ